MSDGKKKLYKIPCSWEMYGWFEVEAESLAEAVELAEEGSLPHGDYVDGSFNVDRDIIENDYPDEEL